MNKNKTIKITEENIIKNIDDNDNDNKIIDDNNNDFITSQ